MVNRTSISSGSSWSWVGSIVLDGGSGITLTGWVCIVDQWSDGVIESSVGGSVHSWFFSRFYRVRVVLCTSDSGATAEIGKEW